MNQRRRWHLAITALIVFGAFAAAFPAQPARAITPGRILIYTFKGDTAERVYGACFQVTGISAVGTICDASSTGGKDGQTLWKDIPPGTYTVTQSMVPAGYRRAPTATVTVMSGLQATVTVRQRSGGNTINLRTVDGDGVLVMGACYEVSNPSEPIFLLCDGMDGLSDGKVGTGGLRIASYTVRQVQTPFGYFRNTAVQTASYSRSGVTKTQTWEITKAPASARIVVTVRNSAGTIVTGACLQLEQPAGVVIGLGCDGDPADGKTTFIAVSPGSYRLVLFNAAGLGSYANPAPRTVTKVGGTVLYVTITLPNA